MYRPPSLHRTLFIAAVTCAGFALLQHFGVYGFPELNVAQRLFYGQWGIVLGYVAAVVAMIGLFHDSRVREERAKREQEQRSCEEQRELLAALQVELQHDLSASLAALSSRASELARALEPLREYERSMKSIYWFAALVLALAATAQFMGLG